MKITFDWLKDHLNTNLKEEKLLEQLTNVGLEVENVENLSEGLNLFMNKLRPSDKFSTFSTSRPTFVSCSKSFSSFRFVFKWSLSQSNVIFIY